MYLNNVYDFTVYDLDKGESKVIRTRPSDIIKSELNVSAEVEKMPEMTQAAYRNYTVLFYALKRMKQLGEYGIAEDAEPMEAADMMAERYAISFKLVEVDDAPLASPQPKK